MTEEVVIPASTEATPVEAQTEVPATTEEVKPPQTYTQEDLDRITDKVRKNERYRTRKEIEAYYQGRESTLAPKPEHEAPKPTDAAPTRDKYESYEDFLDAKAEYTGRKAAREERQRAEQEAAQKRQTEERTQRLSKFQATTREKYPDLNDRIAAVEHIQMPDGMGDAIAESEFGPDVLNHLVSNPKDFERIAALSPSAALREIGRLEARFEKQPAKDATSETTIEVKKVSSAPAPIAPVTPKGVVIDGEPSHDNPEAWRKWRDKQVAARRK